jgi:chemotaxis protein MotA
LAPRVLVRGMRNRLVVRSLPATSRLGITAAAAAVIVIVVAAATGFLDVPSLLIAIGGPAAVVAATYSRDRLRAAWRLVTAALAPADPPDALVEELKTLARVHRVDGIPALERAAARVGDPLLRAAALRAVDADDADELASALTGEVRVRSADDEAARQVLATLGKLFPAFGLIGTLIGLVLLLRNLSGGSVAATGSGLGLAVLTTLYGAVLANVVVLPLLAKVDAHLARATLRMRMIADGVLLVHGRAYPTAVERALRAYMSGAGVESTGDDSLPVERAA